MKGQDVLAALAGQPGGAQLLALGGSREDLALVGGAVRDLWLGRTPRELDVVVAGDAEPLARELAGMLGADTTLHGRFGTAVVEWNAGRVDIARRRGESYRIPGALPEVHPGGIEEDLRRRDFTVNAVAVSLGGPRKGELDAAEHAVEDLATGRLRVLHERSFRDDPTRLLRLARYRARLGFEPDTRTAELAAQALRDDALATVSRARIGAELRLALGEGDAPASLAALDALGVLSALDRRLAFDESLARRALALLPDDGQQEVLLMAALLLPVCAGPEGDPAAVMYELLDGLQFAAGERERVIDTAVHAQSLPRQLERAAKPSELRRALWAQTLEAIALGGAMAERGASTGKGVEAARAWLVSLRHVRLAITGEDLLAAGVPAGPEIGRRLAIALARKLDGELADGRHAELDAAMKARV